MRTLVVTLVALLAPVMWPASLSAADTHMRPCASEDSPGPCFWDAGRRGNHRGYSFWVDRRNHVHYLDPRRNR